MVCKQGAALNLAGTTGAAAIAFAKARQDEGPSALLQQIQKEDSSGTILKVYERVKVRSATGVPWKPGLVSVPCKPAARVTLPTAGSESTNCNRYIDGLSGMTHLVTVLLCYRA